MNANPKKPYPKGLLNKQTFICVDCESTGLDTNKDRIIEVAACRFTFETILDSFDTLIDPGCLIPEESIAIHHITEEMCKGKPKIKQVLPELLEFIGNDTIIGHGIQFDIDLIDSAAKRHDIPCSIQSNPSFDTLRMARQYGNSPTNSLVELAKHFNVPKSGQHRALMDVKMNIEVFKRLSEAYKNVKDLVDILSRPIEMKKMPLGKHKGRLLRDIPHQYLRWAAGKDFDEDLLYSLRLELKRRKKGTLFTQMGNPFAEL